jgi:energy-coupling factor transporter ATP-binding protein EcfA2
MNKSFVDNIGRKTIVTGHYGSGKTEFAVSLAMLLASQNEETRSSDIKSQKNRPSVINPPNDVAIVDLDIVNPYFRSQERREMLESNGIAVYGSMYRTEITAELPALSAKIRIPLENDSYRVIIDAGGNDAGALVLNQFTKYFRDDKTSVLTVVNANRPETNYIDGILKHISAIEKITKLTISGLVNNTHMLRETTAADIIHGNTLCLEICELTGKKLICNCYPQGVVDPNDLTGLLENLMPLGLYMRPTWLDK